MGIGPIHLLAIMYLLLLFLHHDVRMHDFFYGPIVPEINYSILFYYIHGKRHTTRRAHLPEAVSAWLYLLSLGTMSASGYIENLA